MQPRSPGLRNLNDLFGNFFFSVAFSGSGFKLVVVPRFPSKRPKKFGFRFFLFFLRDEEKYFSRIKYDFKF